MNFFIIKAKHLFLIPVALIIIVFLFFSAEKIQSVFKVGSKEIPIYCVSRSDNKAALTFNCAWNEDDIDSILKTLDAYNVKCTFFIVGEWAEKFPDSVRLIAEHGHEIANHSYSHSHYKALGYEQILSDIEKCDKVLYDICQQKPTLFRAAYGEYNDATVKACEDNNRFCIQWSVDSLDYGDARGEDIYKRVVGGIQPGSIILMHTGTKNTAKILPKILSDICSKYRLTTVSDIIYKENYIIDGTGKQIKS